MKLIPFLCLLLLIAGMFSPVTAQAQSSDWQGIDKANVRLVSATTALGNSSELLLGLQFEMAKNWKVYWRTPGDAGFPPEIDWSGSSNLKEAKMLWPVPQRFEVLGLETLGYKDKVVFPLKLQPTDTNKPLDLSAQVRFLTCDDVCIPVNVQLNMSLPVGVAQASTEAQMISQYNSLVPQTGSLMGYEVGPAVLYENADQKSGILRLEVTHEGGFEKTDALVEGPIEFAFFKPELRVHDSKERLLIDVPMDGLQFIEGAYTEKPFTLTFMDGAQAIETPVRVSAAQGFPPTLSGYVLPEVNAGPQEDLVVILIFALLGGVILNLMPCVLPVLSIKVLGLIRHAGAEPKTVRLSFLASSAGILFSFWLLAGFLVTLKAAGGAIGWGIQFQEPLFLIALLCVIVLFACNMWGVFEIQLPGWLSSIGASSSQTKGLGGHFLTGAFATLLATPCSAPFLGTAVGFALARGAGDIFMVFSALGLGLSLPYLAIALFPKMASLLPKPGPWMVTLRKVLALLLGATALWLLSVLAVQVSLIGAVVLGVVMGAVVVVLTLKPLRHRAGPLIGALLLLAFVVPTVLTPEQAQKDEVDDIWVSFAPDDISAQVQQGHVVFVDVTAKWCITCQVNKKLVMYEDDVYRRLSDDKLIAMKADWTNPDPIIADYLASFEKFAIPFNVVYGPAKPEGVVLPELLTKESVLNAIKLARG